MLLYFTLRLTVTGNDGCDRIGTPDRSFHFPHIPHICNHGCHNLFTCHLDPLIALNSSHFPLNLDYTIRWRCPHCKTYNDPTLRRCSMCKETLASCEAVWKCPACGDYNSETDTNCINCKYDNPATTKT